MNIFKSLSQGNGRISETNITSFLSYLLNSTNEFDNSFIVLFIDLIDKNLSNEKVSDILHLNQVSLREKTTYFSKHYSATATPEYSVKKDDSTQFIDVYLSVSGKNNQEEKTLVYILIENKIKVASAKKEQVSKQYEYFVQTKEFQENPAPVISVVLTSDFEIFSQMHTNAIKLNPNSAWLKWTNRKDKEDANSIASTLRNMLIMEQHADIHPINPNSQFILKSFIDYISTEFSNISNGERNFSFNGSDEVERANVLVDGKNYSIRRYENKMIRVFDDHDTLYDIEVLPFLRKVKDLYKLGVDVNHPTNTPKNTQVFGKEIITSLNNVGDINEAPPEVQPDSALPVRNFSFSDSEVVESCKAEMNGKTYIIKRYANKMIRIFDSDGNVLDISVLSFLKNLNALHNLKVDTLHSSGTPKNTQVFGKDVISAINSLKV